MVKEVTSLTNISSLLPDEAVMLPPPSKADDFLTLSRTYEANC